MRIHGSVWTRAEAHPLGGAGHDSGPVLTAGKICTRDVIVMYPGETLGTAVHEMIDRRMGTAVIVERRGNASVPVGMLTDRDIVREQRQHELDLLSLTVEQVMTPNPLCIAEYESLCQAIEDMRARSAQRVPVVNQSGALIGVLSIDELVSAIAEQLASLASSIEWQPRRTTPS